MVEVGSGVITSSETEDLDWINNWKKYFTSFTIDDILIKPTWEELKEEDKDKFLIEIDPGISFGTGKHETTQLCIRQLQKYVEGKHPKVLDVGCGSGILSIVALKLGAREVVGTDLDADCMTSTRDNMQVNHLDLSLGTFYVGNLIDDEELQEKVGTEEYEIVVANILAPVIIAMAPVIPARLKQGGYFITSGIIDFKENEVKEAIEKTGCKVLGAVLNNVDFDLYSNRKYYYKSERYAYYYNSVTSYSEAISFNRFTSAFWTPPICILLFTIRIRFFGMSVTHSSPITLFLESKQLERFRILPFRKKLKCLCHPGGP